MIHDLFEICEKLCKPRKLSVLTYTIVRRVDSNWSEIGNILRDIGAYGCESSHKRVEIFISGDIGVVEKYQGGNHRTCSQNLKEVLSFSPSRLAHVNRPILHKCQLGKFHR